MRQRLRDIGKIFAAAGFGRGRARAASFSSPSAAEGDFAVLRGKERAAFAALLFERFWRRFLPLALIVLLFASACWLNLFTVLPPALHWAALALFAAAFAAAAVFLTLLPLPQRREAAARLARDSGLRFDQTELDSAVLPRPVSPAAAALWRAHKKRLRQMLPPLRCAAPRPNIPAYDRYGLRAAVFLLFAVSFAYSLGPGGGRLSDAFYFGPPLSAADLQIHAWINPPEWTGRPPVYLRAGGAEDGAASAAQAVSAPAGSLLTVQAHDSGRGFARLRCALADGSAVAPARQSAADSVYALRLTQSARCRLTSPRGAQDWNITAETVPPPRIVWAGAPQRALSGILKLRYAVYGDYGVKKAWAEITPLADPAAAPRYFARLEGAPQVIKRPGGSLTLWRGTDFRAGANPAAAGEFAADDGESAPATAPLIPLPRISLALPPFGAGAAAGQASAAQTEANLSKSAWAGAAVSLRLAAEDGGGQVGYSAPRQLVLPQQIFVSPLARSLSEQRRLLAESSANAPRAASMLAALLLRPEQTIPEKGAVLALYSLRARLALAPRALSLAALRAAAADNNLRLSAQELAALQRGEIAARDAALRDVAAYMGAIAAGIDGGGLAAAEKRLQQAAQALREGLRNGAGQEEISRLMQNLRAAADAYIAMLAERGLSPQQGGGQMLGESDLEQKLKALEEAAKQGQRGAAEQMLSDFAELMKNLQVTQGGGAGGAAGGRQSCMQRQMDALSDLMRRQQQLLDDTHKNRERGLRAAPEQNEGGGGARPNEADGQNGKAAPQQPLQSLEERQQALQNDLRGLRRQMESEGQAPKDGFKAAGGQMEESRRALARGDASRAQEAQAQALQNLRDDAQNVMEKMHEALAKEDAARGAENGQSAAEKPAESGGRDPLGRPAGTGQAESGGSLPEAEAGARARRILEEIRKRLGALTPQPEKEYLERLLNFE